MFDIENFNLVQDDNYYYVFRSLEAGDISDREKGITNVMRTDRERYRRVPKYKEDSNISLEEMFDHIKIHYRQDTNCISFTTSAAVASLYGRDTDSFEEGVFNDQYIILKIPKDELGKKSFFAPQYFIEEINKHLNNYYTSANETVKKIFDSIDRCETQEQLDELKSFKFSNTIFEGGIEFETTTSLKYSTLTSEQNLAKNKLIAKIDLLPDNILKNATNKFLVQTLGSAFASMEVTHYQSISSEYLIDCPTYILDIFSILQQSNNTKIKEIEKIIIDKLSNNELNDLEPFKYYNYEINDEDLSIDKLYNISDNGKVDYNTMKNLYIKTFYLAKSKLRAYHSVKLLRDILGNSYDEVLSELLDTYGIEPKITNKQSINKINISDSVGLSYSTEKEKKLFNIVNNDYGNIKDLEVLINNKEDCVSIVMMDLLDEDNIMSKEYYYCNAIIDSFDWKQFNIRNIALRHRNNLIKRLKESNFMDLYNNLKDKNYSSKEISRIILSNIIKNNTEIDLESTFTIEELQDYLGYFRLKNSNLKLTRYQANAVTNMKKAYEKYNYTNVILPTGTGKSFVAISEMLNYLNNGQKVLYLAPDTEILYQIKYYLVSEILGDNFLESNIDNIVKKYYPSLYLSTYPNLQRGKGGEQILSTKFDFIVMDELHRTGAVEWKDALETLYKNQNDKCKVLGITATPTRDCDGIDMSEYWASFFKYTDEEIYSNKHLAYNMDFNQAITLGYLANPRVVNCDYEFLTESSEIRDYINLVNELKDEDQKQKLFSKLKNDIANAKGVPEILKENIKEEDRCLVFCPRVDYDESTGVPLTDKQKIEKYKLRLEEIYGKDSIECYSMLGSYSDDTNQKQLESFNNSSSDKRKFMLVLDKMNEGKHGKYNKLIWFRALDDNSFVLCSQQLGRISKLIKAGHTLTEEERPLAIDLPNNLLRIQKDSKLKKSIASDDISRFKLVVDWIKEYNKIPNINSKDSVESNMAGILKVIIFMYHKRVFDLDSIKDIKKRYKAKEIKRLAEELDFDIWNLYLPNRTKETKKRKNVPYYAKVNPIYRDYVSNLEKLKEANNSIEDKINYIYDIYLKTGKMPNTNCQERFSNDTLIGSWINNNKNNLKELANAGNEKAKIIIEKLNEKIVLSVEQAVDEICAIYEKTGKMPNTNCQERFSNDTLIGSWINNNKNNLKELANEGNEKAKFIVEKLGLAFTTEQAVDEIYMIYEQTGKVPKKNDSYKFSNGTVIGPWLNQSKRDKIDQLAQQGNQKAKIIIEKLNEKIEITKEKAVDEIYAIYERTGIMPNTKCQERFSNDTLIGSWINNNKNNIKELANEGNEKAKTIVEILYTNFTIEQAVDEIYAIYERTGTMPNTQCKENFSNEKQIGNWINTKKNQKKIKELAEQGNEKAKIIVDKLGFDFTIEQAVDEIYAIYETTGKMPNSRCKERFSNETKIGNWINTKKNQKKIKELAEQGIEKAKIIIELSDRGNEKAKIIIEKLNEKIVLSVEQAVNEIYEIYLSTGKMPNTQCKERFSNGNLIGAFLAKSKIKQAIIELAEQGNEKAKIIIEKLNEKNALSVEQAVDEIYAIYETTGTMPDTTCQERFSNQTKIGNWINTKKNKKMIKELSEQGNEKAKIIIECLEKSLTIEQAVEEIYHIYETTGTMPNTNCKEKFSNETKIGNWISNKNNQKIIKELSEQGNEKAQIIVKKLGFDFTIEQAIDEIYAIYETTGKIPNSRCQERFGNEAIIGTWLINKKNQQSIIELADQGNEKAKIIYEALDIKKNKEDLENLCNEYNIDYKKNKKYIDRIPYSIFKSILKYFIDNNINYIDSEGLLISDFYMSSIDFSNKYGMSIQELVNKVKKR